MIKNHFLKKPKEGPTVFSKELLLMKNGWKGIFTILSLLFINTIFAQTTLINPATDGGFNGAHGWTLANQGTGAVKWAVGTAVSSTNAGTTQTTTATGMNTTAPYTVTLSASNANITIGQLVSGTNIQANTYVANISGTTLTLSLPTTNPTTIATPVTLTFGAVPYNITGSSAYVSGDNGVTNSYVGIGGARTVYFYKDVTVPSGETNIALNFDWKAIGNGWQVFVAPTSVTPVGSDVQTSIPATITGATSVFSATSGTGTIQRAYASIPSSFAGTTMRLIFMWSNSASGGSNPPAAIDNVSLVSRMGGQSFSSLKTGNFSDPTTWDLGYIPSSDDEVVINAGHIVNIDAKAISVGSMYVAGAGAIVQYSFNSDEFTVNNDIQVSGTGAKFNVYIPTSTTAVPATGTGKTLNVKHNIDVVSGGRLDASLSSCILNLNGSALQTISDNAGTGFFGGINATTTSANNSGLFNQLNFNNASTAIPNVDWQVNNIRVKILRLLSGKVNLGTNKIILGNYSNLFASSVTCNLGNGFIGGTVGRWFNSGGSVINPGVDYYDTSSAIPYPFLSATGANRWAYVNATGTITAAEVAVAYTDATSVSSITPVVDGTYSIDKRFDGSWTITKDATFATTGAMSLGLYAAGAYYANDGSSRVMHASAVATGNHVNGTTTPFVTRSGMTVADLTAGAFYVGINSNSAQPSVSKTSATSGNWSDAATWTPAGAPTCSDVVTIATGHTVTVNSACNALGVTINSGGTLVNASGLLTVGCTNNNAIFTNFGTNTVSGGALTVNGGVYHKAGSTFNHTAGDIIVDSNNNGDAATSVGQGGSAFKIETSNLNLTGGKITIVDPLVNNSISTVATTVTSFSATLSGTAGTFTKTTNSVTALGATSMTMATLNSGSLIYAAGMTVTGTGIAPGTTVVSSTVGFTGSPITVNLSQPTTASIASGASITFSTINNGCSTIVLTPTGSSPTGSAYVAVGQTISGPGIPAGTTVTSVFSDLIGSGGLAVGLSQPVTGLGVAPITGTQTYTFSGASPGCSVVILSAAPTSIVAGQAVSGVGIPVGTYVASFYTAGSIRVDLTNAATGAMTAPASLTFFDANANSNAFAYNSANNYAAGLNHTLQIGDGVSTQKGAVTTNGYYCNFAQGGGTLSLGNLTVDALDGDNRFFNVINNVNVQNALTVTAGSVYKKGTAGSTYFGGNITNNGTILGITTVNLANFIGGVAVPTALSQTISGSGVFYNNLITTSSTGSLISLTVNNTNAAGVTIAIPNFRVAQSITMTSGIIHTSAATPLYQGLVDLSVGSSIGGNFSNTCYIDGPLSKCLPLSNTSYYIYPLGKDGKYLPVSLQQTGGGVFIAEAFTTNAGTTSANVSNLSASRWAVSRVGTSGGFTNFNVRLGDSPITAANLIVQASTDQGVYDNVLGSTFTYTAGTPNTIETPSTGTIPAATFVGNFAYATAPNCTTVTPGNTLATKTVVCPSELVSLSLQNTPTTPGVIYQWQSSTDGTSYSDISGATASTYNAIVTVSTYYRCNVTCTFGPSSALSTPVQITLTNSITTTTPGSVCDSGSATLGATASAGTINWYDAATGGTSLATGTSFTTPSISTTTTYYASAESTSVYTAGKVYASTLTQASPYTGIVFNAAKNIHLTSVKVHPKQTLGAADAGAPITIKLFDANGNQVAGTSAVTFIPVTNTGAASTSFSNVVTLDFDIPAGTGYKLLATSGISSTNALGRLTTTTYPVALNSISVTAGASSLIATDANYSNFFDLNVTDACISPRVPVVATVGVTVNPTFNAISSVCQGSIAPVLPTTSLNGVVGTWSPSSIDTSAVGTFSYIFTPDAGQLCALSASVDITVNDCTVYSTSLLVSATIPPSVTPGKYLYAIGITLPSGSSITNYEYEVTNLTSNMVGTYQTTNNYFRLLDVPGIAQYYTTYAVRVKLQVNGVWQPYGIVKNVNTNVLSSVAMSGTYCGTTLSAITKTIGCTLLPIATSYIFEVTDVATSAVSTYTSSTNLFSLINLATDSFPIKFNHQYSVRVQYTALVDGETITSAFSSACTITTPVGDPVPTIISPACNSVVSYAGSLVRCTYVASASEYRFDLASASASHSLSGRTVNNFSFSLIDGYVSGTLYSVTPWVKLYGVWYEGTTCNLTSPGTAAVVAKGEVNSNQQISSAFAVKAYPNPFAENFKLNVTSSIEGALQVKVYDMLGKLVENKELNVSDIETLEVGTNYPSGVYNVVVSQGENVQSLRVIKR